jgi:hypothetical protein
MRYLMAALAAVLFSGCATAPAAPPIELVRVHVTPGKSKGDLCRAARDWAAVTFRDSKAVVEVYDPDAGSMIGKGVFMIPALTEQWPAHFTMVVECKDGKARATYRDVVMTLFISGTRYDVPPNDQGLIKSRAYAEQKLSELDASFGAALLKGASDW